MNCEEANKVDLVDYLFSLGFTPKKIRGNDHWYLSPLRDEKEASFKVNRSKNVWYDHGSGKGGSVIDFVMQYFNCDVPEALQKIGAYFPVINSGIVPTILSSEAVLTNANNPDLFTQSQISFQQQTNTVRESYNDGERPPFHLHENSLNSNAAETAIQIIAAKKPITDLMLCRYLNERRIDKEIADTYCHEVRFKMNDKDKEYTAIGFKNSAGRYELRNDYLKLGSSPKYVTYINSLDDQNESGKSKRKLPKIVDESTPNETRIGTKNLVSNREENNQIIDQTQVTKLGKSVAVFEGFFDFLTYQTINKNQHNELTSLPVRQTGFLVLNSLAFFERSLLLMEKHDTVYLYLDHDDAGRKCLETAQKRSLKYKDESSLYNGYKDLNDWVMNFGKLQKAQVLKHSKGMRLP